MKKRTRRVLAFFMAFVMLFNVAATPVEAFSLGGFFKKVSNAVTSTVKSIQSFVDRSDTKTVYNFSELSSFTTSLFAPTDITVKLGADIYVPSNRSISTVLHNITMDMNGHTIYSSNPEYTFFFSYGRKVTMKNGHVVQRVSNSNGIIYVSGGDVTITNVDFKKSSSASKVTGLYISGAIADPEITFDNVVFDGMTTGLSILCGASVIMKNSLIKNSQGDAIYMPANYFTDHKSRLNITNSTIKYSKGNGINAGYGTDVKATDVTITGGTNRNRYGILAGKDSDVKLYGNSKVYANAGGNIGVYKGNPVTISGIGSSNRYSFTVVDGLNGTNPETVANVSTSFGGNIRSLPVYSDISRFMVRSNEQNNEIMIQNPPAQCNVKVETVWSDSEKQLKEEDNDYAFVSLNGGEEDKQSAVTTKYDAKVTLSTTNQNPDRYRFVGWRECVDGVDRDIISTQNLCQIDTVYENVTYKAEYEYMRYTIKVQASGKGRVTGTGTYCVDEEVTLTATPYAGDATKTYAFNKWNDGNREANRTIIVTKDETYTGMFKKTGQQTGTMYLGLKEVTTSTVPNAKLLLVYVGKGYENNRMETGAGATIGVTGLPEGSAKMRLATSSESSGKAPSNSARTGYTFTEGKANYYGYEYGSADATTSNTTCVYWDQKAADFDNCNPGFIRRDYINGEYCWLYWCSGGAVQAAGPYVLYQYDSEVQFSMSTVKITMNPDFRPSKEGDTIDSSSIVAVANAADGTEYVLGGLKFGGEEVDLDNLIKYSDGDKSIALELDGITCDYEFPEAVVNGKQYTKLTEALEAVSQNDLEEIIEIVGPGVDAIDVKSPVDMKEGNKIQGYDGETVTSLKDSQIGVDRDGTVRLTRGTLQVDPGAADQASVGVKDAFAVTDKKITVTTDEDGRTVMIPAEADTILKISPDNNPDHVVTIEKTGEGVPYGFDNIPSYAGEDVKVGKETEYTVNVPNADGSTTPIKTSKYNTEDTKITEEGGMPVITSSGEGDKVTVGDNTYTTGSEGTTSYKVNPDQNAEPSVILETGKLGIPLNATIEVKNTIIKNTGNTEDGAVSSSNPVQIGADGKIDIPDGAGVTINGIQIEVPAQTPMNGNTLVTINDEGEPIIKTTGDSEVKLVINGNETVYQVGDYDCVISIDDDGAPVIEDGEIKLQPGQTIKDRLGNEYKCPEDASEGITIMTTPVVYETDDSGNLILGADGEPIAVGGGDMSFILPENQSILCKPSGDLFYLEFANPGSDEGLFNLDPAKAGEGIKADSEMGLAPGKKMDLSAGDDKVTVEVPALGNTGDILVDGSAGTVTLTKAGDKVMIGGKEYVSGEDSTVITIDENGVTLVQGTVRPMDDAAVIVEGMQISGATSNNNPIQVEAGYTDEEGYHPSSIETTGVTKFEIAPAGKEDAAVEFETKDGSHKYEIGIDGALTLPAGDSITRKEGSSKVEIQAPGDVSVKVKPLSEPSKSELAGGDAAPIGGLLLETEIGKAINIGGKSYRGTAVDGLTEEQLAGLTMQLVLDEKGNVVLYEGTVELDADADISLYDINNEMAYVRNTSKAGEKVQVTSPGVVTMPTAGAAITVGTGKNAMEYTSAVEDTQLAYTAEFCLLRKGAVILNPEEEILAKDMVVKNTSTGKDIKVSINEEEIEEGEFGYTGTIEVPNGGSFSLAALGSDKEVGYRSNVQGGGTSEFTINLDGNVVLPTGGIVDLKDSAGKTTSVQAGVDNVESIPTSDGAMFAVPKDGYIVVDGKKYTNASDAEEDYLILSVNHEGQVILVKGKAELSEGAIIYVETEEETLVPIANTSSSETQDKTVCVEYSGVEYEYGDNEQIINTTYPDVDVKVPVGTSISIGENGYEAVEPETGKTEIEISVNVSENADKPSSGSDISGDRITLESGSVDLDEDSSITVKVPQDGMMPEVEKVVKNTGSEGSNPVLVGSDASVELPIGSEASIDGASVIKVPEASGDGDYKVAVDLTDADGKIKVEIQTEDGTGTSDGGKTVIINDGTYVSKEDGKNLTLSLDPSNKEVSLSEGSKAVDLADGASLVVGDTTVTATSDTKITVTETTISGTSGTETVPKVDIPAGGEANFKNPSDNQDIDISVPEATEGENKNQAVTVDSDGSIILELKKDETIVIGGIEYTGTSDSDTDNKLKVDGTTGELLEKPENAPPIMKIDPEQFNKPDYTHTLKVGESIKVGEVEYTAIAGETIMLKGNPYGNPIVVLGDAEDAVMIDGTTYVATSDNTQFVREDTGAIVLRDNGATSPTENSGLKLTGKEPQKVNGITYSGSKDEDSYTVTYNRGGCYVTVTDGSKLCVDMPKDTKIYVADKGAVKATNEQNEEVDVFFTQPVPVTMAGAAGSMYLDKTKEGYQDTAFIQIVGSKEMSITYCTDGATGEKTIAAISIQNKRVIIRPDTGKTEENVTNIPIAGGDNSVDVAVVVEESKVTVGELTLEDVEKLVENLGEKTHISIDMSELGTKIDTVVLPNTTMQSLAEKAADESNNVEGLTIKLSTGIVEMDAVSLEAIVGQAGSEDITLMVDDKAVEAFTEEQKNAVKDVEVYGAVDAYYLCNGVRVGNFGGGHVTVKLPFTVPDNHEPDKFYIQYVSDDGKVVTKYDTVYEEGYLVFTADHFSDFLILYSGKLTDGEDGPIVPAAGVTYTYTKLFARVSKVTDSSLTLKWRKQSDVDGYLIYGKRADTGKMKLLDAIEDETQTTWTHANLKKGTYYTYTVHAYKIVDGKRVVVTKSRYVYATTQGGNYGNAVNVKVKEKEITLKVGESYVVDASAVTRKGKKNKVYKKVRIASRAPKIASTNLTNKIVAKSKGTCYVYAYAQNGTYVKIKVTVK